MASYMAERRAKRRNALIALFGGMCQKCPSTENLEFNHLDRTKKKFVLSGCHLDKAWSVILAEADKCELVCRECHNAYTRGQYATGELYPPNKNLSPFLHGTARTYSETNCRCIPCKAAKREYRAKRLTYTEQLA